MARILVVEDEPLIALLYEHLLSSFGHAVVGPAHSVRAAMKLVESVPIDAAVLDVNLGRGESVATVADALRSRRVPFVFATAYPDLTMLPPDLRHVPKLGKPFDDLGLRRAIGDLITPSRREPGHVAP